MNENTSYSTKEGFLELVDDTSHENCPLDSLAIFLINIPCYNMSGYPDADGLFGIGLDETINQFEELGLQTVIVWLDVSF